MGFIVKVLEEREVDPGLDPPVLRPKAGDFMHARVYSFGDHRKDSKILGCSQI